MFFHAHAGDCFELVAFEREIGAPQTIWQPAAYGFISFGGTERLFKRARQRCDAEAFLFGFAEVGGIAGIGISSATTGPGVPLRKA